MNNILEIKREANSSKVIDLFDFYKDKNDFSKSKVEQTHSNNYPIFTSNYPERLFHNQSNPFIWKIISLYPMEFPFQNYEINSEEKSKTENYLMESEYIEKFTFGFSSPIYSRLKMFATLQKGWDSYSAVPIKWSTIAKGIDFISRILYSRFLKKLSYIPIPFIAPLSDGGIQFEWNSCYKELIITIPEDDACPIEYLQIEKTSLSETKKEGNTFNFEDAIFLINGWFLDDRN
ncbi:MAG: hypothetical protein KJ808_07350 [Acidobacteria bacterium]|nr:hypothetical protein [Acidobacteriota bacterium]MBU4307530.1 hypothetical protein [Acidobacteriota bacterium]MBU4405015.1 hypothetical protein [Acidobacteriota bacterium]MCG2810913.1 hypothetical protein [Candidatus Aminicenantes bacterium]